MCPSSGEARLTVRRPISEGAVRLCTCPEEEGSKKSLAVCIIAMCDSCSVKKKRSHRSYRTLVIFLTYKKGML